MAKVVQDIREVNRIKRLEYANQYKDFNWCSDKMVTIFSDEKTLQSAPNGKPRIRRRKGDRLNPTKVLYQLKSKLCKVNLWSYITPDGVGKLYSAHGNTQYTIRYVKDKKVVRKNRFPTFNGEAYLNVLKKAIPELNKKYGKFNFVQDNASFHKINDVLNYLDDKVNLISHPPQSPDLNLIERCWNIMQMRYNQMAEKYGEPKTPIKLFKMAEKCWNSIEPEFVKNKLYALMNDRLREVRALDGRRTTG